MGVDFADHYQALAISRDADVEAIRSAWRRQARRHHPDVAKGRGAARRFIRIRQAYEVLSDPEQRRAYDAWLERVSPSRPRREQRTTARDARAGARRRGFGLGALGIIHLDVRIGGPPRRHGRT